MEKFTVVAIGNLNLREGPGEAFEIVNQVPRGYTFNVIDVAKDGGGHKWYKTSIDNGWVKSVYVAQPNITNKTNANIRVKSTNENTAISIGSVTSSILGVGIQALGLAGIAGNLLGPSASTQEQILGRRIFGTPHQFIESTDGRPSDGGPFGLEFLTNIMAETPILSILPGVPDYLADMDVDRKAEFTKDLAKTVNDTLEKAQMEALNDKDLDLKFFEFQPRCMEYMTYVNVLCRMCAVFLGIAETPVPGYEGTYTYGDFNWFRWNLSNAYAGKNQSGTDFTSIGKSIMSTIDGVKNTVKSITEKGKEILDKGIDGFMSKQDEEVTGNAKTQKDENTFKSANQIQNNSLNRYYMDQYYIDFFVKPPSYSESFQNGTTTSMLAGGIQQASNMAKELQFLVGGAMGYESGKFNEQIGDFTKNQEQLIKSANMDEGIKKIMTSLITGSTSVITGANLIFPEIWESSSYSRDFSLEITLSTPYGNRESIFLCELVPLCFLLGLVLPRQVTVNSYSAPFLVRCTVPGFFACDMGIVKDMSITKGGPSGDSWTKDGLPTEITVTLNISDLYNSLSMNNYRTPKNMWNFLWNGPLLDYIGVACGLNMRSSEYEKKMSLIYCLTENWPSDQVDYTWGSIGEQAAMARTRIFGAKG